jgi:thymidylate synthase (FAD)
VWNEVSRRYVDTEPEFYFPSEWRGRAENVKQGSSDTSIDITIDYGTGLFGGIRDPFLSAMQDSHESYTALLEKGVCPEQARMVLPQNTMTEWIWTGSLPFFTRVIALRTDPHTQQETQEVAKRLKEEIPKCFEHSLTALLGE